MEANSPAQQKYWFKVPVVLTIRQLRPGSAGWFWSVTIVTPDIFANCFIWVPVC